jgi:threonine dehydrogenase-like Zn-dependent dehydrogenase
VDAAASAPGDELDVVVDTSGAPDAAPAAARLLRRGGRLVLVGTAGAGTVVRFGDDDLVRRELEVVGSLSYTADDWREALRMVTAHEIDLERVATHRFPIDEYVAALEMFTSRREAVGRILLRHADGGAR